MRFQVTSAPYSSLQWTNAASLVSQLGQGLLLAKVDISHAYCNIPVHPQDRRLLGMHWEGALFIDTTLPFGLRSAPKIFCAISDTLEWVLYKEGISSCLHYIDDFLTVGSPSSSQCRRNLDLLQAVCNKLGVPLAADKIEGPATVLIFLGIELDAQLMVVRLPQDKLEHIQSSVAQWLDRKAATKREMLSLIGELAHACKVVQTGRTFLQRLIDLAHSRTCLSHWIRINAEFKSDLLWWHCFLEQWNGQSLLMTHLSCPPAFTVFTDASGSWGCGAVWEPHWLQIQWPNSWKTTNIAVKELVAVVLALGVWGKNWANSHVLVCCDNIAVVEVIRTKICRDKLLMQMLCSMQFLCAKRDLRVSAQHVPGVDNTLADALSRNNVKNFFLSPKGRPSSHSGTGQPPGLSYGITARLDLCQLESEAAQLLRHGLTESTIKTYSSAQQIFTVFCARLNLTPLPASEETLILFVAELSQTRAHSTIKIYLSAVRHLHVIHGLGNPLKDTLRLELAMKGVQRSKPNLSHPCLPITPRILRLIKASLAA